MKRVLVISDTHCGHLSGLTPPGWQVNKKPEDGEPHTNRDKFSGLQRIYWDFYERSIKAHGPFDIVLVNGDCIEGTGWRSGGTELITTDRREQSEMAVYCIRKACNKNTRIVMTYGTASHVGDEEDWEALIAHDAGAEKIGSHEWVDVDGWIFDLKHHCGSSAVPHGRHTDIAKDRLWNLLWSEHKMQPKSDIIIRSHVHYFDYCGGRDWLAITTPALQGFGTKYGSRRCSGLVDFGMIVFELTKNSRTWNPIIADLPQLAPSVIQL